MNFDVNRFIEESKYNEEKARYLSNFRIVDVLYRKSLDFAYIKAENDIVLPYSIYMDLLNYFKRHGLSNIKLYIKAKDQDLPIKEINLYLESYCHNNNTFSLCVPVISDNGFMLSYTDKKEYENDIHDLENLKLYFYDLGYRKEIDMRVKENGFVIEEKEMLPRPLEKKQEPVSNTNYYRSKKKEYKDITIDDMVDTLYDVRFKGEIFKVDERQSKTNSTIQTLYVKDENNAVIVKLVEGKRFNKELISKNVVGQCAIFSGNYRFDNFTNDYIFEPLVIEHIDKINVLKDDADKKRVELHMHTKLSEMDGVSSPTEVVESAFSMGHRAVAITDHLCLQGYHEAYSAYKNIMKKNKEEKPDFKLLYGCEMNMVYPELEIVYNANDRNLSEEEYVVFDLESTGLSTRHDYIIEFGAVIMRRGTVIKSKDILIKPPVSLSTKIKSLTHILESDLQSARTFRECADEILEFIGDRVLVAHNAHFDYGLLNEELIRNGFEPLGNVVVDTLDLSRTLFKDRRAFRLGNMCRAYNIPYDENIAHRANYDADVLAQVFSFMLKDLARNNVRTFNELQNYQDDNAFVKNRAYHTTVLCKNKDGLKDLFKLVSISNTDTLAIFGKANTKSTADSEFIAEPRIFKETIDKYRKNLLIGSACFNGEVFEMASTRSKEDLAKAISFYDYIEIQPLENYRFLYDDR